MARTFGAPALAQVRSGSPARLRELSPREANHEIAPVSGNGADTPEPAGNPPTQGDSSARDPGFGEDAPIPDARRAVGPPRPSEVGSSCLRRALLPSRGSSPSSIDWWGRRSPGIG